MPKNKNFVAIQGTAIKATGTYIIPVLIDDTLCLKFAEQADSKWGKTLGYSTLQRVLDNAEAIKRIMGVTDANTIKAQATSAAIVVNSAALAPMIADGTISQMAVMAYLTEKYGFDAKQANDFSTNEAAISEATAFYAAQKANVAPSPVESFEQAKKNAAHVSATPSTFHAAKRDAKENTPQVREIVATSTAKQAIVTGDVYQAFVNKYPYGTSTDKITQKDWNALTKEEIDAYRAGTMRAWDAKMQSNDNATVKDATPQADKPKKGERMPIQYSVRVRDAAGNANENVNVGTIKQDIYVSLNGKKLVTNILRDGKPFKADYIVATYPGDPNANHKYAQAVRDGYITEL